jgi:HK97 family phage major capsid protein
LDITAHRSASNFVQALGILAQSKGNMAGALQVARSSFGPQSPVTRLVEKQVISTGDLQDDPDITAARRGFLELTKAKSLISRIGGWRRTKFETRTLRQTVAPSATWVGQNQSFPVTTTNFKGELLPRRKIGTICVTTDEVAKAAGEGFTAPLSADLVRAVTDLEARSLFDPANAGIPDIAPPSLTYGLPGIPSQGTLASDVRADLAALTANFAGDLESAVMVMHSDTALALAMMQNPLGTSSVNVRGGDLFGVPVYATSAMPVDTSGGIVALLDPTRVLLADEGAGVDVSQEATLNIGEDSNGDPITLSLWQQNLVGFRTERHLNWLAAPGAVQYLTGVNWGVA